MEFLTSLKIKKKLHLISLWKIKKSDKKDVANRFNTFFANIGPDLSRKIPQHQDKNMESYLKEKILYSFNFELIEQDIVKSSKD